MVEDKKKWFSKKKREYPENEDWTFPDIESAFRAIQRDIKDKQKEINRANHYIPTYFGSKKRDRTDGKRHFTQGYKITTNPDGRTKITKIGNRHPKELRLNFQKNEDPKPLLDIIQTKKEVMVVIELPGVNKKDININVSNKELLVSAKKSNTLFSKKIDLPIKINKNKSSAVYKNGVLTITLPKTKKN